MNHYFRKIAIALFSAVATGAFAAAEDGAEQRVEITAPSVAINAAQVVLSQRDLDATYEMSSGRRMAVTTSGDGVLMRYGRRAPTALRHDGQGTFVSNDGRFELQFALDRAGEPQSVRLTLPVTWQ
ncbi:MAG: hypothetical protein U5L05_15230 [Rubrivivax sp.]|nr:hypothetical protein [Rubrivivax sp.]